MNYKEVMNKLGRNKQTGYTGYVTGFVTDKESGKVIKVLLSNAHIKGDTTDVQWVQDIQDFELVE